MWSEEQGLEEEADGGAWIVYLSTTSTSSSSSSSSSEVTQPSASS